MKLVVEFDVDVDIIDVPKTVIDNKDILQKKFLRWLYNKNSKHDYWKIIKYDNGSSFCGLQYRSDAFVNWLNKKVLADVNETATIVELHANNPPDNLPKISF